MNRTHDLRQTMPYLLNAINASPPAEIMILDYNSQDGLGEFIEETRSHYHNISYARGVGYFSFNLSHAYNLAVRASVGEFVSIMGTDAVPSKDYIEHIRTAMIENDFDWVHGDTLTGIITIRRWVFMAAGGYDERLEFYGGEDKDLAWRLNRRGAKCGVFKTKGRLRVLRTSEEEKLKNYHSKLTKEQMMERNTAIRKQNARDNVLVANQGKAWGQWQ